ncbi:hypothetical protein [Microcystis phage Mae-JY35]
MKTAREIIARSACAEVNDVSFDELPEVATYLERKTHVPRSFLDKGEARSSADAILAALAAEGFSIVETGRDPVTIEACAKVADELAAERREKERAIGGWPSTATPVANHFWCEEIADEIRALSRSIREGKTG